MAPARVNRLAPTQTKAAVITPPYRPIAYSLSRCDIGASSGRRTWRTTTATTPISDSAMLAAASARRSGRIERGAPNVHRDEDEPHEHGAGEESLHPAGGPRAAAELGGHGCAGGDHR